MKNEIEQIRVSVLEKERSEEIKKGKAVGGAGT